MGLLGDGSELGSVACDVGVASDGLEGLDGAVGVGVLLECVLIGVAVPV